MFDQNLLTLNAHSYCWECLHPLQREKEGSSLIKYFCPLSIDMHRAQLIGSWAETLLNCLPSVSLYFIVTMPVFIIVKCCL